MNPSLSILICGTPRRVETHAIPLIRRLESLAGELPVEILYLLDNKKRSVGKKRQALLDIAQGYYVSYVDDDDEVSDDYISAIVEVIKGDARSGTSPDVITFDQIADVDGHVGLVRFGLGNPNMPFHPSRVTLRNAWHVCAWRRDIAQTESFPDIMDGEDWAWASRLCAKATRSHHIHKPLHTYRFRSAVTEATGMNKT